MGNARHVRAQLENFPDSNSEPEALLAHLSSDEKPIPARGSLFHAPSDRDLGPVTPSSLSIVLGLLSGIRRTCLLPLPLLTAHLIPSSHFCVAVNLWVSSSSSLSANLNVQPFTLLPLLTPISSLGNCTPTNFKFMHCFLLRHNWHITL